MSLKDEHIFVQIPSYKDTQLPFTINSLLENAYNSERLNIAVCWQHDEREKLPVAIKRNKKIKIIDIDYKESKGANWARSVVQRQWNGEPYTFIIDSHIRFVKHWDKKLLDMFALLKKQGVSQPLLTGYPPPFDPESYPKSRIHYPLKMYVEGYYFGLLTKFNGQAIPHFRRIDAPITAHYISLGFLFTNGSFNAHIPFDPNIYFYGDEITTGLRAYCHGYDFYHPHRVIAWHAYDRKTRTPHWDDNSNWTLLDGKSCKRIRNIFEGQVYKNFPLGTKRSIGAYEKFIGQKLISDEQY